MKIAMLIALLILCPPVGLIVLWEGHQRAGEARRRREREEVATRVAPDSLFALQRVLEALSTPADPNKAWTTADAYTGVSAGDD